MKLTRKLAAARVQSQLRFLLRAARGEDRVTKGVSKAVSAIRAALRAMAHAEGIHSIRGHEGDAGRAYFSALPQLLKKEIDARLRFSGRSRRPPKDRFNAILSFGYALLYRDVMQAILSVGLEPAFGFYHRPRSASHPLALDLMELFRVPIWDMSVIGSLNRMQWHAEKDFTVAGPQVWLNEAGRKKAIGLYEQRKAAKWKHPVIGYALSYARLIELETRLLEKEWTGKPGLFARMRLR